MDLLRRLGPSEIDELRKKFGTQGLGMGPFSILLSDVTGSGIEELCDLFNDIDVKMEGRVSWDQFTMHAIDDGMAEKEETDSEIMRYVLECVYYDEIPYSIKRLHWYEGINKIGKLVNRGRQSLVKLCNPLTMTPWKVTTSLGAPPLCAEVIPNTIGNDQLVVSCSDMSMSFWDAPTGNTAIMPMMHTVRLDESQLCCKWSPRFSRLLSGSRSGVLSMWVTSETPAVQSCEKLHHQAINDILLIDNTVLTASMDSTIKITDISKGRVQSELKGHQQGVCLLTYCKEHSLLVSAGYEYDPYVWCFQMNDMTPLRLQDKQRPHRATLMGLEAIPDTPQLISVDQKGIMKIWDVRTLRCVQTLVAEAPSQQLGGQQQVASSSLTSACCAPSQQKMYLSGRTLSVFKYDSTSLPGCADDKPASVVLYNRYLNSYLTAHERVVKIWDDAGKLLQRYEVESEVTCCALDNNGRRIFLGMHNGVVRGYGWTTGQCFVVHREHAGYEIVTIEYVERAREPRQLICSSVKGTWVLPDSEQTRSVHVKCVGKAAAEEKGVITSTCYDRSTSTIVVATTTGCVYCCDVASHNCIGCCARGEGEVRCLSFLRPLAVVVFTENNGVMHLAAMKDTWPTKTLLSFQAVSPRFTLQAMDIILNAEDTNGPQKAGERASCVVNEDLLHDFEPGSLGGGTPHLVTCLDYFADACELYTGDEKGWVVVYCLKVVVRELKAEHPRQLTPEQVAGKRMWLAHHDEVRMLQVVGEKKRVVTSSFDGQVLVWTCKGMCVLSLRQGADPTSLPALEPDDARSDDDVDIDEAPRGRRLTDMQNMQNALSPCGFLSPMSQGRRVSTPGSIVSPLAPVSKGQLLKPFAQKTVAKKVKLAQPEPPSTPFNPAPRPRPKLHLSSISLDGKEPVSAGYPGSHFRKKRY